MLKGVADVLWGDVLNGVTKSLDKLVGRVGPKAFDKGLELGKKVFDRV